MSPPDTAAEELEQKFWFLQHDSTREFVLVQEDVFNNPPDWLINNQIIVTRYPDGAFFWDVHLGHVDGAELGALNRIMYRIYMSDSHTESCGGDALVAEVVKMQLQALRDSDLKKHPLLGSQPITRLVLDIAQSGSAVGSRAVQEV